MAKSLLIVESPAKIKTLKKFLDKSFIIESSVGHIRDLPEKSFGIDIEKEFEPQYEILPDKKAVIKKLQQAAKECDTIYLSPDPDREGEAIAWHITHILPKNKVIQRVTFNSITKEAVLEGIHHPRAIDLDLVNAQQARRLLDRLVGYTISPFLSKRIKRAGSHFLSAGRVQSVALKLVVDREKEIEAFIPQEYWNILAHFFPQTPENFFCSYLHSIEGKKIEKEATEKPHILIDNEQKAQEVLDRIKKTTSFTVTRLEKKERQRHPVAPFITSTLQQEASRHYHYSSSRTMAIAQSLYEGVDMGNEGTEGLITYMRTDSTRISSEAIDLVRKYIESYYGKSYLPHSFKEYSMKKNSQDAHEAIRPTNLNHPPEKIAPFLSKDQLNLYTLIWKRFIASQMNPAIYDTVSVDIESDQNLMFRATGSTLKFSGFLKVYEEKTDEKEETLDDNIPPLEEGQRVFLKELKSEQAFTRPPPRYTEASLVKELEKSGIGRPSTYASIMNKIQSRDYTIKESNRLHPTELGKLIALMLETNFHTIMNIGFTAKMEDDLELVADHKLEWKTLLKDFWMQFEPVLKHAEKEGVVPKIPTEYTCPKCESKLLKVWAKGNFFLGCEKYPDCDFTSSLEAFEFDKNQYNPDFDWDQKCPQCHSSMIIRHGRFGAFLGCSQYPDCRGIINIPKKGESIETAESLPPCPAIGCSGQLTAKRSRYGKIFYACSSFPECDVIGNQIEAILEKYKEHPKTAYQKKTKKASSKASSKKTAKKEKTQKKTRSTSPKTSSAISVPKEFEAVIGKKTVPRNEIMKNIWDYIKTQNLQDPKDKRTILPDEKLAELLGSQDPISMFQMTGKISQKLKEGLAQDSDT